MEATQTGGKPEQTAVDSASDLAAAPRQKRFRSDVVASGKSPEKEQPRERHCEPSHGAGEERQSPERRDREVCSGLLFRKFGREKVSAYSHALQIAYWFFRSLTIFFVIIEKLLNMD